MYATEHGPQGGDELNPIVAGKNYGWPVETYGAHYGSYDWPAAPIPGHRSRSRCSPGCRRSASRT